MMTPEELKEAAYATLRKYGSGYGPPVLDAAAVVEREQKRTHNAIVMEEIAQALREIARP